MARSAKELTAVEVRHINKKGKYAVGGVSGLYLNVNKSGGKSWILRCMVGNLRREIGLGGYPTITLSMAREKARDLHLLISQGVDPVEQKKSQKQALKQSQAAMISFAEAAERCHRKQSAEFKNIKHAAQWINTLKTYAFPVIGDMHVNDITMHDVLAVLKPIWQEKTETASRVRMRIEAVFAWSFVSGYRQGDNPARWSGHLDAILPAPAKVKKLKGDNHHAAMSYKQVPAFIAYLKKSTSISSKALQFLTLTGTRSGEVRGAKWSEVDLKAAVWIIPAERMKAGREHRVPLSDEAIELLKGLPRFIGTDHIFPSIRKKVPLTSAGIAKPLKKYNPDYTVHGMRSAFRDWIAEETDFQNIVAEMALAHTIGGATEAAYRRGDLFDKRKELMQAWSEYCQSHAGGQVVKLAK